MQGFLPARTSALFLILLVLIQTENLSHGLRADENTLTIPVALTSVFDGKAPQGPDELKAMQAHFRKLSEKVMPVTVGIQNGPIYGSGVIVSEDGYVLTAAHVAGEPGESAELHFTNGKSVSAKSLGMHVRVDMGLMKIEGDGPWPHLKMGDSNKARTGQWCLAAGHPGGFETNPHPVIRVGRILENRDDAIKTDCTLISGDSGGPLLDMQGRVLGIHSRVGVRLDLNLHVPVTNYRENWDRLTNGRLWGLMSRPGPYIGVKWDRNSDKAKILTVYPQSPAKEAGIRRGDTIVKFGEKTVETFPDLAKLVGQSQPGDQVAISVRRGRQLVELELLIGDDT